MTEPQNPDMIEHQPARLLPIEETSDSISYLGVKLPKASIIDTPFVPQRDQYGDFIEDRFALDLQKQIAISFAQGDPILVEGGTSIGKTTTVRKMAADLGWEVHYANLNGATDVEDLMGRYIPNPDKKAPGDPEYVFADGKVTMGLRQEEGKIKVIILDELNSAAPNILIRLHEVLDALQRGEQVVLSEDASEAVSVDKMKTKIIGLMNPPGRGYFGREPLDPAQLRRWIYIKAPTDLPQDTFSYSTDAMFAIASQTEAVTQQAFMSSRDQALLPEQLTEIPGLGEILAKYKEFHEAAKELVKTRKVAADQPQQFTFDDRMEPRRVRDFILRFYNGDITGTFQNSLRYYYANKLESDTDRAKLEELIMHVEYTPPKTTSHRKGFERGQRNEYTLANGELVAYLNEPLDNGGTLIMPYTEVEIEGKPFVYFGKDPTTREAVLIPKDQVHALETESKIPDETKSDIVNSESEAWQSFLGKRVEIPAPPAELLKVLEKAEAKGIKIFEPHYLPSMKFSQEDTHPGWNIKPEDWYWEQIKADSISADAPALGGHWVLVDKSPKPEYADGSQLYEDDPLKDLLSSLKIGGKLKQYDETPEGSRFAISWDELHESVFPELEKALGLKAGALRLPTEIEFNVLGNLHHPDWGDTNTWEWFEDKFEDGGRLIGGRSDSGGLADVDWDGHGARGDCIGFRPLIVFSS